MAIDRPSSRVEIDFVLPVYNEAHVLAASVGKLLSALPDRSALPWRIVIIDNGSTDETWAVAQQFAAQHEHVTCVHLDQKGRGRALRKTWSESDAEFSLYMDIDLSTDLSAVPVAVELLRSDADIVTGSRLDRRSQTTRSLKREILSRGFNLLRRLILRTRSFDDAQCGFKGVRLVAIRQLLPLIHDLNWFFDTELLTLAEYSGLTIRSIPITWIEDPDTRVKFISSIAEHLRGIVHLRLHARAFLGSRRP